VSHLQVFILGAIFGEVVTFLLLLGLSSIGDNDRTDERPDSHW
jgi:hypothetical protein